jgi:hypothetical protein
VFDEVGRPVFSSACIERGWRDNKKGESCVIAGIYPLIFEYSPKFNTNLWELKDTPGRSECKIHVANSWHQLEGCICPGIKLKDIDNDGYIDVTDSRGTLELLHRVLKDQQNVKIEIIDWF